MTEHYTSRDLRHCAPACQFALPPCLPRIIAATPCNPQHGRQAPAHTKAESSGRPTGESTRVMIRNHIQGGDEASGVEARAWSCRLPCHKACGRPAPGWPGMRIGTLHNTRAGLFHHAAMRMAAAICMQKELVGCQPMKRRRPDKQSCSSSQTFWRPMQAVAHYQR